MRHHRLLALALLITASCATTTSTPTPTLPHGQFQPPGYVRGNKDTKADRVIIFIHGVFGDGTGTWTNKNGAYFPQLLRDDPTFEGADIWVHQFPSPKRGHTYSIDELGAHLRKHLNDDNVITNHRELVFVAHSMGGIITRAFLLQHREITPERVRMLYFFSTPTTGSEVANLARLFSNNPQLVDLRPMTTQDAGILGVYQNHWLSSPLRSIPTYCGYELLPTKGLQVVQRTSATNLCTMRLDPVNRDHLGIVKPGSDADESYLALRDAYRDTFERGHRTNLTPAWNLQHHDRALLEVRNVTQAPYCENECWSHRVTVAAGDNVLLAVSYANDALITAKDARVRLAVPQTPLQIAQITATLSASNVQPAHGQVTLLALTPVLLVPTRVWRDTRDETRPLPYTQSPAQVLTDGIRLGDIGIAAESERLVVEFRCEPATIVMEGDALIANLEHVFKMNKNGPPEEDLPKLMTPDFPGRVEELGWTSAWVSDVHDVHDDGSIMAQLFHHNNSNNVLRNLRVRVEVTDQTAVSATLHIVLSDSVGEIRTDTADIRFRQGTTQRLVLSGAYRAPKTLFHQIAALSSVMNGGAPPPDDDAIEEFPIAAPNEILLGDLPPQTSIAAAIELVMTRAQMPPSPPAPKQQTLRTTLNRQVEYPLLQVATEQYTREWKTHLAAFRRGDPLAFTFYFKNTGAAVARDARLRLQLTHNDHGILAEGRITAANADTLAGTTRVAFERPGAIKLYYDQTVLYRFSSDVGRVIGPQVLKDEILLGDLDQNEWGWVKVMYSTAPHDDVACANIAAISGKRIEFAIALDNPSREPLRDIKLRVRPDHLPREVRTTISLATGSKELVQRVYKANTLGERVVLHYRDAQVYTSEIGRNIDAKEATDAPVAVGDVPPNGQLFVRLTYDVMPEPPEGCVRKTCQGVNCPTVPCQF